AGESGLVCLLSGMAPIRATANGRRRPGTAGAVPAGGGNRHRGRTPAAGREDGGRPAARPVAFSAATRALVAGPFLERRFPGAGGRTVVRASVPQHGAPGSLSPGPGTRFRLRFRRQPVPDANIGPVRPPAGDTLPTVALAAVDRRGGAAGCDPGRPAEVKGERPARC